MRPCTDHRTLRGDYSVDIRRTGRRALVALGALLLSASACSEGSTPGEGDSAGGSPSAGASSAGASTAGASTAGASTAGASTAGASTGGIAGASTGGVGGAAAATGGAPGGAGVGGTPTGGAAGAIGPAGAAGVSMAGNGGASMAGSGGAATAGNGGAMAGSGGAATAGNGGAMAGSGGASGAAGKGSAGAGGSAGKGGAGSGGSAGKGGASTGGSGGMAPTMGCGATTWPTAGNKTITVGTTSRTFVMYVPTGYDTNRPYPVIMSWHGLTGSQGGFYSLNTAARAGASALMVSPQGLDNASMGGTGWWNENGRDLAYVDALITWLSTNYCVDRNRLFSVGFSFGGMFSHLIGCERGDVFRAIAPIAGSFFNYYGGGGAMCDYPVPMIGIHGTADTSVTPASGRNARNVWLTENGCTMTTMPSTPTECVDYQGCMGENAVKWCEHPGTHMVPSFAADAIWNFFRQF